MQQESPRSVLNELHANDEQLRALLQFSDSHKKPGSVGLDLASPHYRGAWRAWRGGGGAGPGKGGMGRGVVIPQLGFVTQDGALPPGLACVCFVIPHYKATV